jgi:hypothetical protein
MLHVNESLVPFRIETDTRNPHEAARVRKALVEVIPAVAPVLPYLV